MALQTLLSCPDGIDDTFGPWAGPGCRGGFDFTLFFEDSILTIPLYCLFLIALPVRVYQLARANVKVVPSLHKTTKLVSRRVLARADTLSMLADKCETRRLGCCYSIHLC